MQLLKPGGVFKIVGRAWSVNWERRWVMEGEDEKAAKEVKVGQSDIERAGACAGPAVAIGRRQRLIEFM